MNADIASTVRELDSRAEAARASGDSAEEASALQEAAAALIPAGDLAGVRRRLGAALSLHLAAGRPRDAAGARYLLALTEGRVAGDVVAAEGLLKQALTGFVETGEASMAGRCRMHLASMALGRNEAEGADAHLAKAIADFARAGDHGRELAAISARIMTLQLLSKAAEALALTGRALALSEGDVAANLKLRLTRLPLLRQAPRTPELPVDSLDAVLADAERAGQLSLSGQARLTRASTRQGSGDLAGALVDADAARQAALGVPDPVLYLLACLCVAELHEARGDQLAAITALFTCQASLADLLGEEARKPVLWVIAMRRRRWGEARWQEIMGAYRQQFA